MARIDLEHELAAVPAMSSVQLRARWSQLTDQPVPKVSPALLRLALSYELQARVHGGLSRAAQQRLKQLEAARTVTREARAGMRLLREWNGTLHVVTIADDETIVWNGEHWPSLSKVAREITGTRWSGPAFFGLKQKRAA